LCKILFIINILIFNSFDIIAIIGVLSEKYLVEIDPDDVSEEYFDSIDGIIKLVQSKLEKRVQLVT